MNRKEENLRAIAESGVLEMKNVEFRGVINHDGILLDIEVKQNIYHRKKEEKMRHDRI